METPNYDESKVPEYTLPDPLTCLDGERVTNRETWPAKRRPELLSLFKEHVYGYGPGSNPGIQFIPAQKDEDALGGKAVRRQVSIRFTHRKREHRLELLLYIPKKTRPAPAFAGLNFWGNHTVSEDRGIKLSKGWFRPHGDGIENSRATEASRGSSSGRWQVEKIIAGGFALSTAYYGDLEPDHPEGWKDGIRAFLHPDGKNAEFAPTDCGAIGAWAWGLSRIMDYLEKDEDIDDKNVALMGHSRLGKTALWAGALDERFKITISNNSGCGGAALSRRKFGETIEAINTLAPHWFAGKFKEYNGRESELPVDQHELVSLIAPRPVYIASAAEDLWADPRGEFLSAAGAEPVYELFGKKGTGTKEMPPAGKSAGEHIGYHVREGKHGVTAFDWEQYIRFAKRHFKT